MPAVYRAAFDDSGALQAIDEALNHDHPGHRFGVGHVETSTGLELRAPAGKVRFLWIAEGSGHVYLPGGYRTQEGDGAPLPPGYRPDPVPGEAAHHLGVLKTHASACHPRLLPHVERILSRWREPYFTGDISGDLWGIANTGVPEEAWNPGPAATAALRYLMGNGHRLGWSTKAGAGSFEPVGPGDQLIAWEDGPLLVEGRFRYWWMDVDQDPEDRERWSVARRLTYIRDTSGGCNPAFDAYRRLLTCWRTDRPEANRVNSHVVHIEAATSSTHYHPAAGEAGAPGQSELYLVLDPADRGLRPAPGGAKLHVYPDLGDLARFETLALQPGDVVYIPPGTGHRGVDTFVNVLAVPGFRPQNEFGIDADIAAAAGERAPYNRDLAG